MPLPRKVILVVALALGAFAAVAWVASYFWWPQVSFPWPTSGLDQTHDHGFVLLIDGRLFIVRQRVQLSVASTDARAGQPTVIIGTAARNLENPPLMLEHIDAVAPSEEELYFVADSRTLGTLILKSISVLDREIFTSGGTLVMRSLEPELAETSWRWLGFASKPLAVPRMRVKGADVIAPWTKTALPLWPLVLLAAPAAIVLLRGRRSRRWAAEGRCIGCGYDLRESPERCPECGRTTFRGTAANRIAACDAGG